MRSSRGQQCVLRRRWQHCVHDLRKSMAGLQLRNGCVLQFVLQSADMVTLSRFSRIVTELLAPRLLGCGLGSYPGPQAFSQ